MSIDILLSKLDKVRSNGNGKYLACCPAHNDKSPSLSIKETEDGKILIHCFSGCVVADIVASVSLELSDLMPDNPTYKKGTKQPPRHNKYELFDLLVHESIILSLGIRQLLNFEDLSPADLLRIVHAENVINDITREVKR